MRDESVRGLKGKFVNEKLSCGVQGGEVFGVTNPLVALNLGYDSIVFLLTTKESATNKSCRSSYDGHVSKGLAP